MRLNSIRGFDEVVDEVRTYFYHLIDLETDAVYLIREDNMENVLSKEKVEKGDFILKYDASAYAWDDQYRLVGRFNLGRTLEGKNFWFFSTEDGIEINGSEFKGSEDLIDFEVKISRLFLTNKLVKTLPAAGDSVADLPA